MFWPCTVKNISTMFKSNLLDSSISILKAIDELEGLKVLLISKPAVFQMPAGMIYATVTMSNSSHVALVPLSPGLFQESIINLDMVYDQHEKMVHHLKESEAQVVNDPMAEAFTALTRWRQLVVVGELDGKARRLDPKLSDSLQRLQTAANNPPYNRNLSFPDWMTRVGKINKQAKAIGSKRVQPNMDNSGSTNLLFTSIEELE